MTISASTSSSASSTSSAPVSVSAADQPIPAALSAIAHSQARPPTLTETFLSQYEGALKLQEEDPEKARQLLQGAVHHNPTVLKQAGYGGQLQEARFLYGKMCLHGEGGQVDRARGMAYLRAASMDKHSGATYEWALFESDPEKAKGLFQLASSQGSPQARVHLAYFFLEEDPVKSQELIEEVRKLGHQEPEYALAKLLVTAGKKEAALFWIRQAAEQNHAAAIYDSAQAIKDSDLARYGQLIARSAELGCAEAQFEMGVQYAGLEPENAWLEADYEKAKEFFLKAAIQNHPGALSGLANLYQSGTGVAEDFVKARKLYIAAIHAAKKWQQGPLFAPLFDQAPVYQALAEMTRDGAGCAPDAILALEFKRRFLALQKI
jgi:TPR repeat protein